MKVIFLDIDGVLNNQFSKSKCCGAIGIDDKKVILLKEIVDATNAVIVLTSSWKSGYDLINKENQDEWANYLDRKLNRQGLRVFDITRDKGSDRGHGIVDWLQNHKNIESWIVLDDDIFDDYEECGIMPHLIKTNFYDEFGGLRSDHVEKSKVLLNFNLTLSEEEINNIVGEYIRMLERMI